MACSAFEPLLSPVITGPRGPSINKLAMTTTRAHCNACGGDRNHAVLHSEKTSWVSDDEHAISGGDKYETLKCLGCDTIKLRHTSWCSEDEGPTVHYFPPSVFRKRPEWMSALWLELPTEEEFVDGLLEEIYNALQNNQRRLAAMGIRALLEQIMIAKVGDHRSFVKNLQEFEAAGYVSSKQKERLETILEAGHATIHRSFLPSKIDLVALVDIAESVIETTYIHDSQVKELRKRIPPRGE